MLTGVKKKKKKKYYKLRPVLQMLNDPRVEMKKTRVYVTTNKKKKKRRKTTREQGAFLHKSILYFIPVRFSPVYGFDQRRTTSIPIKRTSSQNF